MKEKISFLFPFLLILVVYLLGLPIDVMEVDAAQYASMSREMLASNNWLELYCRHEPYLDKPPLLFWLSAASFKVLGVSNFAYKLPSLIFALASIYAVYRFVRLYYNADIAYNAALILASVQSMFTMTNDVRTDTILMSSVIIALWLLAEYIKHNKIKYLIGGSIFIGLAMLAKGPIGLIAPLMGIATHIILKGDWRLLQRLPIYLVPIPVILCVLSPMLWGLYTQYGFEGWKFFFWTQSFGRITGENEWVNDPGPSFFFVHTFLWVFLPWTILFLIGLFLSVKSIIPKQAKLPEYISLGSFILPFIALSFSQYKLPHYIFIVLPVAAVLSAVGLDYLLKLEEHTMGVKAFNISHRILCLLLFAATIVLIVWAFPLPIFAIAIWALVVMAMAYLVWTKSEGIHRSFNLCLGMVIMVNIILSSHIYPSLLQYQSDNTAARLYIQKGTGTEDIYALGVHNHGLDFYSERVVPYIIKTETILALAQNRTIWVYTDDVHKSEVENRKIKITESYLLQDYPITKLTIPFVNPATRQSTLNKRYFLKLGE